MDQSLAEHMLEDAISTFRDYKKLADKAITQVNDDELNEVIDEESNSIGLIMKHMSGNMISRWTDFLTSDGEKPDRNRDSEFEQGAETPEELKANWERGWTQLFSALEALKPSDLTRTVTIRGQGLSVVQAIHRQLTHYGYHIGQIVFLAKHIRSTDWKSLSIPKKRNDGTSQEANEGLLRWAKTRQK
jgi:hypothetical protein